MPETHGIHANDVPNLRAQCQRVSRFTLEDIEELFVQALPVTTANLSPGIFVQVHSCELDRIRPVDRPTHTPLLSLVCHLTFQPFLPQEIAISPFYTLRAVMSLRTGQIVVRASASSLNHLGCDVSRCGLGRSQNPATFTQVSFAVTTLCRLRISLFREHRWLHGGEVQKGRRAQ